jgi:anti-sigma factor RsiW
MTAPFTPDLISAYLDGELTPKERAVVEQQLRDHAELRRLYDELRALREMLRTMPTVEPGEGFAQRVLRAAERRMLTGETPVGNPPVVAPGADTAVAAGRGRAWPRNWRVVTGALAMAASLALIAAWVFQPLGRDVAQAPEGDRRGADHPARLLSRADSAVRSEKTSSVELSEAESAPIEESLDRRDVGVTADALAPSPSPRRDLGEFDAPLEPADAHPSRAEKRSQAMSRGRQPSDSPATGGRAVAQEGAAFGALGDGGPTDTDTARPHAAGMGGFAGKPGPGMGGGMEGMMGMPGAGGQLESAPGAGGSGMSAFPGSMFKGGPGAGTDSTMAPADSELGRPMRGVESPTPQSDPVADPVADLADDASPTEMVAERADRSPETPPIRQLTERLGQRETLLLEVRWNRPDNERFGAPPAAAPARPAPGAEPARALVPALESLDESRSLRFPMPTRRVHRLDRKNGEPMPGLIVVDATEEEIHAALAHLGEQAALIPVDTEMERDVLANFAVPPIPTPSPSDSSIEAGQRVEPGPLESADGPLSLILGTLTDKANLSRDRLGVADGVNRTLDSRTATPRDGEEMEYIMFRLIRMPPPRPEADAGE